jgi:Holliday junction resolvase
MVPINSPEIQELARILASYAARDTITRVAGLLTAPQLQANNIRIEVLVHLAVTHCAGKKKPGYSDLEKWLNQHLGQTAVASLEDPVEDVFVTNVETPEGNRRVFEGIWESNDYFLQVVIDTLLSRNAPQECRNLLNPVFALLQLSDYVAERLNLHRWHIEPSTPKGFVPITPRTRVKTLANAVTFTNQDLERIDVTRELLAPFILREKDRRNLIGESTGHSSLEKRPLIDFGDALVLTLPNAVSPAIRRFVLSELRRLGFLPAFGKALGERQARQIEEEGLRDLKNDVIFLSPPPSDKESMPPLHTWLLCYDTKYIHVVLLHDRLEWVDEQGLSSFLEYPETLRAELENYLNKVAKHCQALPDYVDGMTLIIMGGLGRGFSLDFQNWPDGWLLSVMRVSSLLMLAGEIDQPIKRYLKCIKQKNWAESEGVYFQNFNGDFNFYCYWRHLNYQLVPRMLPVGGSAISIGNDFVLSVRQEVRRLSDRHVVQTASGAFARVMRYGRGAYFKSMQDRPIYASISHLDAGILAGIVETSRGPTWLVIQPWEGDHVVRHLLYRMWDGFIGLFDRLVAEVEACKDHLSTNPLEIWLNFKGIIIYEDYISAEARGPIVEPEVSVNIDKLMAVIKFPSEFLVHFQQPENIGEKLVLRSLARGLVSLHQGTQEDVEDTFLETLVRKVISDAGMRVLHLFNTYYPIEHLLARQENKPVFLAHEDFVFAKLRLSEGCTAVKPEAALTTKSECNDFLHKVVEKVWGKLRDLLRQFDRTSVIRQALTAHEAIIRDRDHWRRTAQAIIALYSPAENIFDVAQKREQDRSKASLPARIILEMAICECPTSGGRQLSVWDLDELLANAALLLEAATDSDAINADLLESTIQLHANGEYSIDRRFYETVIRPFIVNYFQGEFEGAAADYGKFYRRDRPNGRTRMDETYSAKFIAAFNAEFGLTPDETVDGIAELFDLAVESNSVVVETTLGILQGRLIRARGLSPSACNAFVKTFGLFHRPAWDRPPQGFNNKELYPWRYGRRLSAVVRPLLIFGENEDDKVFYGAGSLRQGFGYLMDRTERGQLPETFFTSKVMRSYWGAVNDERGHDFARSVADLLRKKGWEARNEVNMTELGASSELGDIDVLAWKPTGEVLLIECKRLQLARTVAEIAEICRRFRGDAKDELDKHVQRINWVLENPLSLERIVGFRPDRARIDAKLVTNTHVPMMYLTSLPITPDQIVPFSILAT